MTSQVVATAGHVDHGKSTLVRALTGMEPDRWAEERRRGMTIDLGFAWTMLPDGTELAFVDVPGHERFVSNMLAGVGAVPAVLLVVAADEGWSAQSGEHLAVLDALGVRHGLLVVTRADLAEPGPALAQAREHLAGTSLAEGVEEVVVSAVTGDGLDRLRGALVGLASRLPPPDPDARLRLWVDRVFTVTGAGTVVTGTLGAGRVSVGDDLVLAGSGRQVRVRALQSRGRSVPTVTGVARVALNLRGDGLVGLARGEALVRSEEWVATGEVDVRLVGGGVPTTGSHLLLHVGSAAVPARFRPFPRAAGTPQLGRLRLPARLPLAIGDRGVLRDPGRHDLVLGVEVLDPLPPPLRRRGAAAARARTLAVPHPDAAEEVRRRGVVALQTLRRLGVDVDGLAPVVGSWCADEALLQRLRGDLRTYVENHRAAHPLEAGVPVGEARAALGLPDPALLEVLAVPPLALAGGRVVPADTGPPAELARAVAQVRADLAQRPFAAPDADRLRALGLGARELAAADRLGLLVRLGDGVVLGPGALESAADLLAQLAQPFTVSQARVALDTTRRVALPLLEALDRQGRTRRLPDGTRSLVSTPSR